MFSYLERNHSAYSHHSNKLKGNLLLLLIDKIMFKFFFQGLKNFAEDLFESDGTQGGTTMKRIDMNKFNEKSRPLLSRFDHFAKNSCSVSLSCEFYIYI